LETLSIYLEGESEESVLLHGEKEFMFEQDIDDIRFPFDSDIAVTDEEMIAGFAKYFESVC
jgi:hypothetical protein